MYSAPASTCDDFGHNCTRHVVPVDGDWERRWKWGDGDPAQRPAAPRQADYAPILKSVATRADWLRTQQGQPQLSAAAFGSGYGDSAPQQRRDNPGLPGNPTILPVSRLGRATPKPAVRAPLDVTSARQPGGHRIATVGRSRCAWPLGAGHDVPTGARHFASAPARQRDAAMPPGGPRR